MNRKLILICNAGSTSLKYRLFEFPEEKEILNGKMERIGYDNSIYSYNILESNKSFKDENIVIRDYEEGINLFLKLLKDENICSLEDLEIVGFKTVLCKGFTGVHIIDDKVIKGLEDYMVVAPAHNGPYLKAIRLFQKLTPKATLVGSFETAFHQTISKEKYIYSIPYEWYEKYGIRKYGYHGASHSYVSSVVNNNFPNTCEKVISLHLGGSCSACAILNGKSIDSSLGFSLNVGIPHSSRCGDIDSVVYPYLLQEGLSIEEIQNGIVKNSGLKGISGISGDVRDLEEIYYKNERAKLAIDVFVYNIIKYIGSFICELEGIDVLAFTGGIGENSFFIRKLILDKLSYLGLVYDEKKNNLRIKEISVISKNESKVKVIVVPANEEIVVARNSFNLVCDN